MFALGCSDRLIFKPPVPGYSAKSLPIVTRNTQAGVGIALVHVPASPGMPTLLWSHGNAEDIGYLRQRFQRFHARGYGILAYDYPGYGLSEGKPDEAGCYDACRTAWDYLTAELKVPTDHIIIYGQSVGSGPAVWLASHETCAGLMLVSPLTSAFRVMTRIPIFPGDKFNNISRIGGIHTPLLVIHGDKDQIIAPWHGKKLYDKHPGPKQWLNIEGAGHNDIYLLNGEQILDTLDAFWKKN